MTSSTLPTNDSSGDVPQRLTVLLVEDDEIVRLSTLDALELLGYHVIAESNASDGLARLHRDSAIDILFTDVVMPSGMSGLELAREARSLRPDLPVLLVSGHAREALGPRHEVEDFAFLAKPYRLQDLAEAMRALKPAVLPAAEQKK